MIMLYALIIIFSLSVNNSSFAIDNLSLQCAGCHNTNGISLPNSTIPSIAGLEPKYFVNALNEYKNNLRSNYVMRIIAKGYSEKEIIKMSLFFSKINNND